MFHQSLKLLENILSTLNAGSPFAKKLLRLPTILNVTREES